MTPLLAVGQLAGASSAVVTTPQVRAELVAHAPAGLAAGQTVWLGLKIEHQPHWHTYWKNPGDSGLPTTLTWTLPVGVSAGDIDWPAPHRLPIGPLMNYGYEGTLLLPVTLTLPAGAAEAGLEVKLRAEWLVCKDVCIPEGGDFVLKLPPQTAIASHAALFDAARAAAPLPLPEARTTATVEGNALQVRVDGLPPAWQGKTLSFLHEAYLVLLRHHQKNKVLHYQCLYIFQQMPSLHQYLFARLQYHGLQKNQHPHQKSAYYLLCLYYSQ
jgi:thiol:disulfide interchange protein DsbD